MMRIKFVSILFLLWVGPAFAQAAAPDRGVIHGRITDAMERPLPGANVQVKGPALSAATGATADAEGRYRIENLPEGTYGVTASYIGYGTDVRKGIRVKAGEAVELDFSLTSEAILQEMMVVSASRKQEKLLQAPASVNVVEAAEVRDHTTLNVVEHVKGAPAVVRTGLLQPERCGRHPVAAIGQSDCGQIDAGGLPDPARGRTGRPTAVYVWLRRAVHAAEDRWYHQRAQREQGRHRRIRFLPAKREFAEPSWAATATARPWMS